MRERAVAYLLFVVLLGAISAAQTAPVANSGEIAISSVSRGPANEAGWVGLKQSGPNREAKVVVTGGKSYRGELSSVSDDALVIHKSKSDRTIARTNVQRVSIKRGSHRGRNALIGAGIGAGTGLGLGAAADQCSQYDLICFGNLGKEVFTPLFGVLGAGIGALMPAGGWLEVYRLQ